MTINETSRRIHLLMDVTLNQMIFMGRDANWRLWMKHFLPGQESTWDQLLELLSTWMSDRYFMQLKSQDLKDFSWEVSEYAEIDSWFIPQLLHLSIPKSESQQKLGYWTFRTFQLCYISDCPNYLSWPPSKSGVQHP